jgi:hypothetical protein
MIGDPPLKRQEGQPKKCKKIVMVRLPGMVIEELKRIAEVRSHGGKKTTVTDLITEGALDVIQRLQHL